MLEDNFRIFCMNGMEMLPLNLDCKKIVMSETDGIKGRKEPKFGL